MREGTVIFIDSSLLFKCYKAHGIFSWIFFCSEEALSIVGEEGKGTISRHITIIIPFLLL